MILFEKMDTRVSENKKKNKSKLQKIIEDTENNSLNVTNKALLVAQDLKFAKLLAGNDLNLKKKVLNNLKKWLKARSSSSFAFEDTDFLRIWKGLFYCMWMSDKPLLQENLAEDLAQLLHCFDNIDISIQFFGTFLQTMSIEWNGIDQWRIDKFMMLVRRVTRQIFFALHRTNWQQDKIKMFTQKLESTVLNIEEVPIGLIMHFNELYLDEIAKVTEGNIKKENVHLLLEPYVLFISKLNNESLTHHTTKSIFFHLLFQSSLGQEYQEKFEIWKKANFPTSNIDDMEVIVKEVEDDDDEDIDEDFEIPEADEDVSEQEDENDDEDNDEITDNNSDEEDEEKAYDPRAGRVNVVLYELKFDANKIIEMFDNLKFKPFINAKSRRARKNIVRKYKKFVQKNFPLGIQQMPNKRALLYDDEEDEIDYDEKARELMELEENLILNGSKLNRKQLKRKNKDSKEDSIIYTNGNTAPKYSNFVKAGELDDGDLEEDEVENSHTIAKRARREKRKLNKKKRTSWKEEDVKPNEITLIQPSSDDESEEGSDTDNYQDAIEEPQQSQKQQQIKVNGNNNKRKSLDSSKMKNETNGVEPRRSLPLMDSASKKMFPINDEWSEPLKEGESEYFLPSVKAKLKEIASGKFISNLVKNPFSNAGLKTPKSKPMNGEEKSKSATTSKASLAMNGTKRVQIVLHKNKAQGTQEYIQQIKNSPSIPYDSAKKPGKGLLKPNLMPSPVNPFYIKQTGIKLNFNDTL